MKKILLLILVSFAATLGVVAQTFEWGTPTWNIEDGKAYSSIDDFNAEGLILTYPNPADYSLTFLNVIVVDYDIFIDDNTEPVKTRSSAQGNCAVKINYYFPEGHKYKIVTTKASLAQANLATYQTDTLSVCDDSYSISFSIDGPEIIETVEAENYMSLAIIDQEYTPTYSVIDSKAICAALGIENISDATIYGLNLNGSYNPEYLTTFDGWRDADGEVTYWGGGYNRYFGHNAYPAVYSIKLNDTADTLRYYFYDYWKVYDPSEGGQTGGGSIVTSKRRLVPDTHYHSTIWDWTNEDGTVTQYKRNYRCDEGEDYKASFMIIANKKAIKINATLHFISIEDYNKYIDSLTATKYTGIIASGISMPADPSTAVLTVSEEQTVTIAMNEEDATADITFSGFKFPMLPATLPETTITAKVEKAADGSITYESDEVAVSVPMGMMSAVYKGKLTGSQASAEATPTLVLTLRQASIVTAVFAADEAAAKDALAAHYAAIATAINNVTTAASVSEIYSINGARQSSITHGVNIIKSNGKTVKVMK